ncbi:carbon-nitrogen hydrolase [Colletotrichum phormii]|uniref:nitrilase n=1 Tax=Colletotrichum phormii TaxID=359342 RepID=A0AAJ0EIJ4_9PEZI|nr:carbon-nitrogen hydrolase [Colletotrichum phormii]KAK1638020.1 carbon-nitrogen hydrolase [Colletotrichum phormii]
MTPSKNVRVALAQEASIDFDLQASVDKTCHIIAEASRAGAHLIAFPETFIPGYPFWIWSRGIDVDLTKRYIKNSLKRDSPEMKRIRAAAAENNIEQSHIGSDGLIRMNRRKIKPTNVERRIFGEGSGSSLRNVASVPGVGKVGGLNCWEHTQPLLKYHTYSQGEQVHIAAWPPTMPGRGGEALWNTTAEGQQSMSRIYAVKGSCFVLHCTGVLTKDAIDKMQTHSGQLYSKPGGGYCAVYGPAGSKISTDLADDEEGIVYADLDMDRIIGVKVFLDTCGHCSRPDLLWLGSDLVEKSGRIMYVSESSGQHVLSKLPAYETEELQSTQ